MTVDQLVSADGNGTITTRAFSTFAPGEIVVVFAASDGPASGGQTLTISGGGLVRSLVRQTNVQAGTSEIWTANALAPLADITITSAQSIDGYHQSLRVVTFVAAAVGSSVAASGSNGAPGAVLLTTQPGSLVFGVGKEWDHAIPRTLAADQTMLHQDVDISNGDTYWVQRRTDAVSVPGTLVTIADTAPTIDRWNFAAVEIVAAQPTTTPSGLEIDQSISREGSRTLSTRAFSASRPGELLVAFAASDGPESAEHTLTIQGGGLVWSLARRANAQLSTSEIWAATSQSAKSGLIPQAERHRCPRSTLLLFSHFHQSDDPFARTPERVTMILGTTAAMRCLLTAATRKPSAYPKTKHDAHCPEVVHVW